MKTQMILLLALPLFAWGSGAKPPAPETKQVDPRILLQCSGPLIFAHAGVAHNRFARRSGTEEAVYRIDMTHNIIETWSDINRKFESICTKDMATCKIDTNPKQFNYKSSMFDNDNGEPIQETESFTINVPASSIREVSSFKVWNKDRLVSTDRAKWDGKCRKL
jgi:hypothetical protein